MTLDEAIKRAEEVAEMKKTLSEESELQGCSMYAIRCGKSAEEHRQLAEWLKELKQLREQTRWIPVSERLPERDTDVLISYRDKKEKGYTDIDITSYGNMYFGVRKVEGVKHWRDPFTYFSSNYEVVAWMPLPKPYKEENKE